VCGTKELGFARESVDLSTAADRTGCASVKTASAANANRDMAILRDVP
jgi:hypothetical protein